MATRASPSPPPPPGFNLLAKLNPDNGPRLDSDDPRLRKPVSPPSLFSRDAGRPTQITFKCSHVHYPGELGENAPEYPEYRDLHQLVFRVNGAIAEPKDALLSFDVTPRTSISVQYYQDRPDAPSEIPIEKVVQAWKAFCERQESMPEGTPAHVQMTAYFHSQPCSLGATRRLIPSLKPVYFFVTHHSSHEGPSLHYECRPFSPEHTSIYCSFFNESFDGRRVVKKPLTTEHGTLSVSGRSYTPSNNDPVSINGDLGNLILTMKGQPNAMHVTQAMLNDAWEQYLTKASEKDSKFLEEKFSAVLSLVVTFEGKNNKAARVEARVTSAKRISPPREGRGWWGAAAYSLQAARDMVTDATSYVRVWTRGAGDLPPNS